MQLAWRFTKDAYRVHCCNRSHARQITAWTGCKRHAVYYYPDGRIEEDVIVPKSRPKKACELAGLVNNHKILADSDSARKNAKSPLLKDNNLQEAEIENLNTEHRSRHGRWGKVSWAMIGSLNQD